MVNKISFGKPLIDKKEINLVTKVLKSGVYVHGPKSKEFEKKFTSFTKAKYAVSVSSCTAGMHLIYFTLGVGKGDEVILPAQTHTATAHAVELAGAKPVFVDCEKKTGNIDIEQVKKKINKKTKAICIVHYLGIPVNLNKIKKIAKKRKIFILEDCALSLGAKYKKIHTGLIGDAGVFSFYPVKHMTTAEGGMIITNNYLLSKKLRLKKAFGINKAFHERKISGIYDAVELGFNYRMSEIHAAIGLEQIKKLPLFLKKRKKNFEFLKKQFSKISNIRVLDDTKNFISKSHYCLNLVLEKKLRNKRILIIDYLKSKKIGTSIYYPQPVPRMSYYKKKYGYNKNRYINASEISDYSISFPVGPHLTQKDLIYIVENFKKIIKRINNE